MPEHASHLLRLLHLADSALPIGATAHSFGLETLVQEGDVDLPLLECWFETYLVEAGAVDAFYCRRAFHWGETLRGAPLPGAPLPGALLPGALLPGALAGWRACNQELSALRPARESRTASHALGGRLLRLLADLQPQPIWHAVLAEQECSTHYCCVFGLGGALLGLDEDQCVLALLRQNVAGLVSACQRLMPLGQGRAGQLLWHLHPLIEAAAAAVDEPPSPFSALLDVGSMRHPQRAVRLFIS